MTKICLAILAIVFCSSVAFGAGAEISPTTAPPSSGPIVWTTSSLVRTGQTDPSPPQLVVPITASLSAARGEYQSFNLVIHGPAGGLKNVNVSASNLVSDSSPTPISAQKNIRLFREQYLDIAPGHTSPGFDGGCTTNCSLGPGTYPDGLIPAVDPDTGDPLTGGQLQAFPFDLDADKNQPIWVDIFVPRGTMTCGSPECIYHGTVTVTSEEGGSEVLVSLKVRNFTLPLQPSLMSSFPGHSVAADTDLMRNRLMPFTIFPKELPGLLPLGLSTTDLGYAAELFFDPNRDPNCPIRIADPESLEVYQKAAAPFDGLSIYDMTFDEPDLQLCPIFHDKIIQWGERLHEAKVKHLIPVVETPDEDDTSLDDAVDIWVEMPRTYKPKQVQRWLGNGSAVWSYNTSFIDPDSPKWFVDFNPLNFRIQPGFINQSLGMSGLLYWQTDGAGAGTGLDVDTDDPRGWTHGPESVLSWTDVERHLHDGCVYQEKPILCPFQGEGILVYPGEPVGMAEGKVAPSMRLKWMRDGVQDFEYVQFLRNLADTEWALSLVRTIAKDWQDWTKDPKELEAVREQLGDRIETLCLSQIAMCN